jgi:hypothetical protein
MKTGLIILVSFSTGAFVSLLLCRNAIERLRRRVKTLRSGGGIETKKSTETMKKVVWVCLGNGFAWVWCSYILAYLDKMQIAESLSQVAVTEIIGVVLAYAIKSLLENLSKNNNWPDKHRAANANTADTAGPEPEREEPTGVGQ